MIEDIVACFNLKTVIDGLMIKLSIFMKTTYFNQFISNGSTLHHERVVSRKKSRFFSSLGYMTYGINAFRNWHSQIQSPFQNVVK